MTLDMKTIKKELSPDEFEEKLLNASNTAETSQMNFTKIVSELHLAITIDETAEKIIKSNEQLAQMQSKSERGIFWLTLAIVGFAAIQLIIETTKFYFTYG